MFHRPLFDVSDPFPTFCSIPLRTEDYSLAIWSNPLLSVMLIWLTLLRKQVYMAPAHTVTFLEPAAVNENMEPIPLVMFTGAAPVIEYVAPQPADFVLLLLSSWRLTLHPHMHRPKGVTVQVNCMLWSASFFQLTPSSHVFSQSLGLASHSCPLAYFTGDGTKPELRRFTPTYHGLTMEQATETMMFSMERRQNSSGTFSQDSQRCSSVIKSMIYWATWDKHQKLSQEEFNLCQCSMSSLVTEKTTKMNAWQMPELWKYLREDLV